MAATLVSVVIPVYRAMPFLRRCLDSLLSQTVVGCMEIVCIDDCGGDDSVGYIKSLQLTHGDNLLRLFSMPKNSGAAAARNFGLTKVRGEYIGFVDADDWCEPDMYESLLSAIRQYNADWAYCLAQKDFPNGRSQLFTQPRISCGNISDADRRLLLTKGIAYFTTGLYSRRFFTDLGLKFPNGKFSEDSYFWWTVLMHSQRLAVVDRVGYHYVIQDNSVSKRPDTDKAALKQSVYSELLLHFRSNRLYDAFAPEIDFLYIKKGLLIPLLIQAINCPETLPDATDRLLARAAADGINPSSNTYCRSDLRARLLYTAFVRTPRLISSLLRLKFRQDPF